MKIVRVESERFAGLRDLHMHFGEPAGRFVCLTGMNGTGKTAVLNLITLAAGMLGSFGGVYDYAAGTMSFSVEFDLADEDKSLWLAGRERFEQLGVQFERFMDDWTKRVTVNARTDDAGNLLTPNVVVGGLETNEAAARALSDVYSKRKSLSLVFLDANRAYSYLHEWRRDKMGDVPDGPDLSVKALAARSGEQLFTEWNKYLLWKEQHSLRGAQRVARAGADSADLIDLLDPFRNLNSMIHYLLPHVSVIGSHHRTGRLLFKSGDSELEFQQLSGGEREIVFILGQLEMLSVYSGVLLLDEPELHLNPLMVRRLIRVLQEFSQDVQTLVATHSFEVAEEGLNAGAVYVLSKSVTGRTELEQVRPGSAHAQLTVHLGMPGISLAGTRFVVVEGGADQPRATERFRELVNFSSGMVFLAVGNNKRDVLQTVSNLENVATEWGESLEIVGIVDSDFDDKYVPPKTVLKLGAHEIENIFLHPDSLDTVAHSLAHIRWTSAAEAVQRYSDDVAGVWIWNHTEHVNNRTWRNVAIDERLKPHRKAFRGLAWSDIEHSTPEYGSILDGLGEDLGAEFVKGTQAYRALRQSSDLWKWCLGKKVLTAVSKDLGLSTNTTDLERRVIHLWHSGQIQMPDVAMDIVRFLGSERDPEGE